MREVQARPLVAVIGASQATPQETAWAREVGRRIAGAGRVLVCGGLGGVMAAACEGACRAGGETIGLLPGRDPAAANRWVRVPIATGLGEARNALIAQAAPGAIAIGGGWGTLSEIALFCRLGKPVVSLGSWRPSETVLEADDPAQALERLLAALAHPA